MWVLVVTVDLDLGQTPSDGADVILGTAQSDKTDGLGGDDIICGGGDADVSGVVSETTSSLVDPVLTIREGMTEMTSSMGAKSTPLSLDRTEMTGQSAGAEMTCGVTKAMTN